MKAFTINEILKFEKGQTPKKTMDIGGKKGIEEAIKKMRDTVSEGTIEQFIEKLQNRRGGGFGLYLSEKDREYLYLFAQIRGLKNIKLKVLYPEADFEIIPEKYRIMEEDMFDYLHYKKIRPLINKGWVEWNEENNENEFREYILLKYVDYE